MVSYLKYIIDYKYLRVYRNILKTFGHLSNFERIKIMLSLLISIIQLTNQC